MSDAKKPEKGNIKKVLIITYYWPPSGGAGVQRWLKFAKYIQLYGCEPVVYTPENPEPPDIDETLMNDIPRNLPVIRKPIWEPYSVYKRMTGKQKNARITHGFLSEEKSKGFMERLSVWIRGNFFIPDARCFWIRPSIKFLSRYLQEHPIDLVISSGPPHSMHLIALGLKKKLNIPWLADFRDPWTEIDYYEKLKLTRLADQRHKILEKKVLTQADCVLTVGKHLAERLKKLGAPKVEVIPNGFDKEDFSFLPVDQEKSFTITHTGSINSDRNPEILWQVLADICTKNKAFNELLRLRFVGKTDHTVKKSLQQCKLESHAEFISYLPHREALKIASSSALLLLLINQTPNQHGIVTGKLFEYLATGRPILCIGPVGGEAAAIIRECECGRTFDYSDSNAIAEWINEMFLNHSDKLQSVAHVDKISRYSRQFQTYELAEIIKNF